MIWTRVGYALLCVIVPAVWGLIVVWASTHVEAFIKRHQKANPGGEPPAEMPPLDYHI